MSETSRRRTTLHPVLWALRASAIFGTLAWLARLWLGVA